MPKKVLIALIPGMLEEVDFIAQAEHRSRSDLIREALRRYINEFKRTHIDMAIENNKAALSKKD
jgi:metal-responsive CopG/Arc/MetJ family transcriptional regulator